MRPDMSYLDQVTEEAEEDLIGMEEEKPKPKSKTLTEVRVEYTKRRNDENHFGPLTYAELSSVQNEEPWVVRSACSSLIPRRKRCFRPRIRPVSRRWSVWR